MHQADLRVDSLQPGKSLPRPQSLQTGESIPSEASFLAISVSMFLREVNSAMPQPSDKLNGCTVSHHLRRARHNRGGGKPQTDNGIRTHGPRLIHQALNSDIPGVVHHLGVGLQLAAYQGFEALADIVANVFRLDSTAHDNSKHLIVLAGNMLCVDNQHIDSPFFRFVVYFYIL